MNQSVREFLSAYPKANVRVEYQHPDRVYRLVERDEADVGLVSYPRNSRGIKAINWRVEPMVLACAPRNPLAGHTTVSLRHMHGQPMIAFQEGLRIRDEIDRVLTAAGVEVNVVMEFDNTEIMKRAIEIDAGIGLLPEPTMTREVSMGTLVAIRLRDKSLVRPLGIIQRRGKTQSETTRRFVEFLLTQSNSSAAETDMANALRPSESASA
jgi:DNA-binding transcriptional LysR family regulator